MTKTLAETTLETIHGVEVTITITPVGARRWTWSALWGVSGRGTCEGYVRSIEGARDEARQCAAAGIARGE